MADRISYGDASRQPILGGVNGVAVGQYKGLHKYLHERFANRLVLTFSEIEDLLGFSLPEEACRDLAWWRLSETTVVASAQSNAWALAGRTATVNLSARCVVFERTVSYGASPTRDKERQDR
jgi:hypothetical protein